MGPSRCFLSAASHFACARTPPLPIIQADRDHYQPFNHPGSTGGDFPNQEAISVNVFDVEIRAVGEQAMATPKNCTAPVEQRLRAELTRDDFTLAGPEA
jgi:hypothetical protein